MADTVTTNYELILPEPNASDDSWGIKLNDNFVTLDTLLRSLSVPSGAVQAFATQSAPEYWLVADGSAVSRTTYANLFAAIGTIYGEGDGATTFNLPDLRGEFIRGWDNGREVDSGRSFGSAQNDAFQGHGHALTTQSNGPGGGSGTYAVGATVLNDRVLQPVTISEFGTVRTATETRPRNIALLYCIKT